MSDQLSKRQKQESLFKDIYGLEKKTELSELINLWEIETELLIKRKLKDIIIKMIETKERQAFLARYKLRDFDTWNKVLTEPEGAVSKAHKAEFYKPNLILILHKNKGCLPALEAISKTVERVKDNLSLADYKLTESKRFRYDTTIRFLADSLKKQGILSTEKKHKNKVWVLTEKGNEYANILLKE